MNTDFERIRQIFLEIVEQPAAQWETLLNEARGNDPRLRQQVAVLLRAHAREDGILDRNQAGQAPTCAVESLSERPGIVIGPYKLLQEIGEGGRGVVWMAEQTKPVQCKVALKVIKPGMDSRHVVARFEAERQALAMMNHANIARVFDGGATEAGRPYFVMELVHGVPITKYCDDHQPTPRERLELFVSVCQAIQHAHPPPRIAPSPLTDANFTRAKMQCVAPSATHFSRGERYSQVRRQTLSRLDITIALRCTCYTINGGPGLALVPVSRGFTATHYRNSTGMPMFLTAQTGTRGRKLVNAARGGFIYNGPVEG